MVMEALVYLFNVETTPDLERYAIVLYPDGLLRDFERSCGESHHMIYDSEVDSSGVQNIEERLPCWR
jgi:hypothetical protein